MKLFLSTLTFIVFLAPHAFSSETAAKQVELMRICLDEDRKELAHCIESSLDLCLKSEGRRAANPSQARTWCHISSTQALDVHVTKWKKLLRQNLPKRELRDFDRTLENWTTGSICVFRSTYRRADFWFFTNPFECDYRAAKFRAENVYDLVQLLENEHFSFQSEP